MFFSNLEKAYNYLQIHEKELETVIATVGFWKEIQIKNENLISIEIGNRTRIGENGTRAALNIYQPGVDIVGDLKKILVALSQAEITFHSERKEKIITFFQQKVEAKRQLWLI